MTSGPPKVYAPLSKIESPRRTMCGIGLSSLGLRGEGEAFAGDEDGGGGRDTELFGVIALIHGDADSAAGVHVEQRLADRDFHEGLDVGQGDGFFVEEQRDFVAEAVSELLEFVAGNIGDERAKRIVQADDVALNALIADGGGFGIQANKLGDLRPHKKEIPTGGEMGGHGREDIAPVESGRDGRLNHPVGVGNFAGGFKAVAVKDGRDEAVIGRMKYWPFLVLTAMALREVPTPGSTTTKKIVPAG